jgi:hypothetical protein
MVQGLAQSFSYSHLLHAVRLRQVLRNRQLRPFVTAMWYGTRRGHVLASALLVLLQLVELQHLDAPFGSILAARLQRLYDLLRCHAPDTANRFGARRASADEPLGTRRADRVPIPALHQNHTTMEIF